MNFNVKKLHPLLLIRNMLFLSILCGLFCVSHANIIRSNRQVCVDEELTEELTNRKDAEDFNRSVNILKSLGAELNQSVENSDSELTQSLLREFKDVWQRLVDNEKGLANSNESAASLRKYWSHILFIAKDRICKSPDETFYQEECLPISTENWSKHCPENMGLFDEHDGGFCDCLDLSGERAKSELRQIYSNETGSCHQQNTQGPCDYGQWFVVKENIAQCAPVPEGCPTDGRHVYWSPEPSMAEKCWEIYTQGPCEDGKLVQLSQETEEFKVYCSFRFSEFTASGGLTKKRCRPGTYQSISGRCSGGWWG